MEDSMKVVKVACGQVFSAALLEDGTLWGCGFMGAQTRKTFRGHAMTRVEICSPLGRIKDVAANYNSLYVVNEQNMLMEVDDSIQRISGHVVKVVTPLCGNSVFALKDYGGVWAGGRYRFADSTFAKIDLPEGLDKNVIALAAGADTNLALVTGDHDLYIGGPNTFGQLGDGTKTDSKTLECVLHDVLQVELVGGGTHTYSLAVTKSGQLYGWGNDDGNWLEQKYGIFTERNARNLVEDGSSMLLLQPQIILENISLVTSGFGHILAITKEGDLLTWGDNSDGQLGDGSFTKRFDPKPVFSGATYAKAGNGCSFVIDHAGQLWACGSNSYGTLGIGNTNRCNSFTRVQFR
jgi:alpha-tubulin suppressor-like RCC1 family protein